MRTGLPQMTLSFYRIRLKRPQPAAVPRPEGMHRELYNLLYSENKELPCPLIPTDSSKGMHTGSFVIPLLYV
jgi:DNA methyltransferase 1-associated protein 1